MHWQLRVTTTHVNERSRRYLSTYQGNLVPREGREGSFPFFLKGKAVGTRVEPWGCLSCSPSSSGTFLNPTTSNFWLWFGLQVAADLSRISHYDHGTNTTLRLTEYSDLYEIIHPSLDLAEVVCGARLIKSRCVNHTSLLGWLKADSINRWETVTYWRAGINLLDYR